MVHEALTHTGFRRSQNIIYRPACDACNACQSARTVVGDFAPSKSQKRVMKRNGDLVRVVRGPEATEEQYVLFNTYLRHRHAEGGMAEMDFVEYTLMVGETPVRTQVVEYRAPDTGALVAAVIVDGLSDGYSLVYSFFDPGYSARSLGTFMVLDQIARAAEDGMDYVYLGYWVQGSAKMDYKAKYAPIEVVTRNGWEALG